jgi:hypothetical protein
VRGDLDDRIGCRHQPVRRAFEQQPASERTRRLAEPGPDQPVEVEAGQIGAGRQVGAGQVGIVEPVLDDVQDPAQPVGFHHVSESAA